MALASPLLQLCRRALATARRRYCLLLAHVFHLALQAQALGPGRLQLLLQLLGIRCASVGGGGSQRRRLRLLEHGLQAGDVTLEGGGRMQPGVTGGGAWPRLHSGRGSHRQALSCVAKPASPH